MDEPIILPSASGLNGEQQQEDAKPCWPAFMTVQNFLVDAPYGNIEAS